MIATFTCPREIYIVHYPTGVILNALRFFILLYTFSIVFTQQKFMLQVDPTAYVGRGNPISGDPIHGRWVQRPGDNLSYCHTPAANLSWAWHSRGGNWYSRYRLGFWDKKFKGCVDHMTFDEVIFNRPRSPLLLLAFRLPPRGELTL